jgi:hypothetical protein
VIIIIILKSDPGVNLGQGLGYELREITHVDAIYVYIKNQSNLVLTPKKFKKRVNGFQTCVLS